MNILINASNLKVGGGLQVADSVCRELYKFPQHHFVVVYTKALANCAKEISFNGNVETIEYETPVNANIVVTGRCKFLDQLVVAKKLDAVLTIFGPSRWIPRLPHLCGFARAQIVLNESPYFTRMKKRELWVQLIKYRIRGLALKRCSDYFYTENSYISVRLEKMWPRKKVYTITNFYNQIFDHPEQWKTKMLPPYDGVTLLTIATPYPHKNLTIAADVARYLLQQYPNFRFRFVFSIDRNDFHADITGIEGCFVFVGKVDIAECPSLYLQCDMVFQPTLLECFTAAYPEAMRMERPIITTDLDFARGLCGDAAEYYSAIDVHACANAIYRVATDSGLKGWLVENGGKQLLKFDNYYQRAQKLINLTEEIVHNTTKTQCE